MRHLQRLQMPRPFRPEQKRMRIDMQPLMLGKLLLIVLALASLNACRNDPAPAITVCLGDGFGGADCSDAQKNHTYKAPSQLVNYWMLSPQDSANFVAWCYGSSVPQIQPAMTEIEEEVRR